MVGVLLQILSRSTQLDDEVYNQLVEKAKEVGYDVGKLHKTPQIEPPPEAAESPNDKVGLWWFKSLIGK